MVVDYILAPKIEGYQNGTLTLGATRMYYSLNTLKGLYRDDIGFRD